MERGFDVCSPRGGRHSRKSNWSMATIFLSTPSARRATSLRRKTYRHWVFLSTPSARRATRSTAEHHRSRRCFYPRPPRGGRQLVKLHIFNAEKISIHALREEGDLPARSAQMPPISIHALREEGDATARDTTCRRMNFYPRPPRGGRPAHHNHAGLQRENFYPRPPRGGRRSSENTMSGVRSFLSTPSMRRATLIFAGNVLTDRNFYPRPP